MRPVLDREAAAVGAPMDLVVGVRGLALQRGQADLELLRRVRAAVRTGVVNQRMDVLADQLVWLLVAEHAQAGGVDEGADALGVDAENGLGGGVQQQLDVLALLRQLLLLQRHGVGHLVEAAREQRDLVAARHVAASAMVTTGEAPYGGGDLLEPARQRDAGGQPDQRDQAHAEQGNGQRDVARLLVCRRQGLVGELHRQYAQRPGGRIDRAHLPARLRGRHHVANAAPDIGDLAAGHDAAVRVGQHDAPQRRLFLRVLKVELVVGVLARQQGGHAQRGQQVQAGPLAGRIEIGRRLARLAQRHAQHAGQHRRLQHEDDQRNTVAQRQAAEHQRPASSLGRRS